MLCFCVESADPCRLEKTTVFGLGEGREVAGLQGSEIKPIACSERRKRRIEGKGGGGESDGESYRKVLLYAAYGTLRCEGGKGRLSVFQSHSCCPSMLLSLYVRHVLVVCVRACVMVSSSLPGDMALCFTARSAVTTTSTTRAVKRHC